MSRWYRKAHLAQSFRWPALPPPNSRNPATPMAGIAEQPAQAYSRVAGAEDVAIDGGSDHRRGGRQILRNVPQDQAISPDMGMASWV